MKRITGSWTGILAMGFFSIASSGCGQRTPAVSEETTHHSSLIIHHASVTTHQTDEQFPFPADGEGRLLTENLRPSEQMPPLTDDKKSSLKRQSGAVKLENPDLPLPAVNINKPASIPSEKGGKPIRPRLLEGEAPLLRGRIEVAHPAAMKLPTGPKVAWSAPDINEPIPLPIMARQVVDRASLDDPSGEASQAAALASKVPERTSPAPFLRLNLPDPFEHRNAVRLRTPPPESPLPIGALRPPGS